MKETKKVHGELLFCEKKYLIIIVSFYFVSTFQVSKAAADLMAYCDAHIREDPLIVPVPASENPFREKKFFCTIL